MCLVIYIFHSSVKNRWQMSSMRPLTSHLTARSLQDQSMWNVFFFREEKHKSTWPFTFIGSQELPAIEIVISINLNYIRVCIQIIIIILIYNHDVIKCKQRSSVDGVEKFKGHDVVTRIKRKSELCHPALWKAIISVNYKQSARLTPVNSNFEIIQ